MRGGGGGGGVGGGGGGGGGGGPDWLSGSAEWIGKKKEGPNCSRLLKRSSPQSMLC